MQPKSTILDVEYSDLPDLDIPAVLKETETPVLQTVLPKNGALEIENSLPTLVYNFYKLDPFWKSDIKANRVLLLEPTHFAKYPVCERTIGFVLKLADNIERIQVFTGEFRELKAQYNLLKSISKNIRPQRITKGSERNVLGCFPKFANIFRRSFPTGKNAKGF